MRLRIASWNMHAGVGLDGRFAPGRIARVLGELDADLVALQEFGSRRDFDMLAHLEQAAAARGIAMPTFSRHGCDFGNVVLSRLEVLSSACIDLACDRREPRNAVDLVVDAGGHALRVVATHLGLRGTERCEQLARIAAVLHGATAPGIVLLGDFNDWRTAVPAALSGLFGPSRAPPTFPSPYPVAALDRIWIAPADVLVALEPHRSRTARVASDHLPLVATLRWPPEYEADP
jgi:endonuclease/exonuclease/phosphatase family metal-dependent hydrolase